MNLTRVVEPVLGPYAARDDVTSRVAAALLAGAIVIAAAAMLPGPVFTPWLIVISHAAMLPALALAPAAWFVPAQAAAAVATYVIARAAETHSVSELAVLAVQELAFFLVLWRAPIDRIGVRRWIIATTTIVLVPVYYWFNWHVFPDQIVLFLGGWRHFVLLLVVTNASRRDPVRTLRNLAIPFFSPTPVPLERADVADRRVVTMLEGALIFAAGLAIRSLYKQYAADWFSFDQVRWDAGLWPLCRALILFAFGAYIWSGMFGFLLMGHCYLIGIRVPAPLLLPHRFTNLAEAWRGTAFYIYRFVYDGYYRQFFVGARTGAFATVAKITVLFWVMGYQHMIWGSPYTSWTGAVDWTIQGLATGLTVLYLQERSKKRVQAYRTKQATARSPWAPLLVPACIAGVLLLRGLFEYGLNDEQIVDHLAMLF